MTDCVCDSPCDLSGSPCDLSGCLSECKEPVDTSETSDFLVSNDEQALVESTWGLRLRSHFTQAIEDISRNIPIIDSRVLHPSIRPPSFEDLANYKPTTESINNLYFQTCLCLLRFFTLSGKFLQGLYVVLCNITKGVKKSVSDQQYLFFEGSSFPYPIEDVKLDKPAVPPVEWYYNATTNTFLTSRLYTNSSNFQTHHIPYLTAEVKYNDLTLYDISEFINSVRWAGEEDEAMPNVDHLVSAWSLSTGIILQRSPAMALNIINTDGNDVRIPLRNEA